MYNVHIVEMWTGEHEFKFIFDVGGMSLTKESNPHKKVGTTTI